MRFKSNTSNKRLNIMLDRGTTEIGKTAMTPIFENNNN